MRRRGLVLLSFVALSGALPQSAAAQTLDPNPCLVAEERAALLCPDLLMKRPHGLYVDRRTRRGRTLLRAGNSIDNVGAGPAELHGRRVAPRFMDATQGIVRRAGGRRMVRTGARLFFKFAHQRRYYWKFHNAARFELWAIDRNGRRTRRVRTGPKVSYCLRDLRRTRGHLRGSPRTYRYPACNTNPRRQSVVLGTSVGWSDIYPPTYPEQWIDVTGLRGCFAYDHIADPLDDVYELNERNNRAGVVVRLPFRSGRQSCPGARGFAPPPATGGSY